MEQNTQEQSTNTHIHKRTHSPKNATSPNR